MSRHILLISVTVLAACSEGTTAPAPSAHRPLSSMMVRPGVTVRILKTLTGATDSVTAFNDSDVVVGTRIQGSTRHAFDWTTATGAQILPAQIGWNSEALGINDVGTVVGDVSSGPHLLPAHWLGGTNLQTMQVLNPGDSLMGQLPGCVVRGINAGGTMTGNCYDPFYPSFVTEWNPQGIVSDFCVPSDCFVSGFGYAINSRGVIAGGPALDFLDLNAFAIFPPATLDTLPKLVGPGPDGVSGDAAFAINAIGVIAGQVWTGGNSNICLGDPAVWRSPFQKPIDIGAQFCGRANGIDGNNVVIGTLQLQPGTQAFIWTQSTGTQALPGLGGTNESSAAVAINNKREVLGSITSSGKTYDVIWTF